MKKRLLSTLLALCMVLALLPSTALAATVQSGTCGANAIWVLDSNGTLTISGTGEMYDYYYRSNNIYVNWVYETPWRLYVSDIRKVVINYGITHIGEAAFGFTDAASVSIPSSVTSIGKAAFEATNLTSVVIPEGVTIINADTFSKCDSLAGVLLPQSLSAVSRSGFSGCTALKNVYYAGTDVQWANVSMSGDSENVLRGPGARITFNYSGSTIPSATTTVVFNTNSSDASVSPSSKTVTPGSAYGTLPTPVRSGYTFDGWYTKSSGGTRVYSTTLVGDTKTHMLYAHWIRNTSSPSSYTVTFNGNGGTPSTQTKRVTNGSTYGTLPTVSRSGYTFNGWYTKSSGGTRVVSSDKVNLSGNQTLYAHWTKSASTSYTVTFKGNSGTPATQTKTVTNGSTYGTLPTVSRSGYTFNGWYTKSSGGTRVVSSDKVNLTGNQTLYAHWTKNQSGTTSGTVKVSLNANGGKVSTSSKTVTRGKTYGSLSTPTRTGYKFNGWYTSISGGTKVTSSTTVSTTSTAQTLYAHWTKENRKFFVFFDPNGGEPILRDSQTAFIGAKYQNLPTPVRDGYHFDGWWTKSSGGTKVSEGTQITQTISHYLYAHWTKSPIKPTRTQTGNWKVIIPAYYEVPLYKTNTDATWPSYLPEFSNYRTFTCTKKTTLSNGTVRYYAGFSGNQYFWFTYTEEMEVK